MPTIPPQSSSEEIEMEHMQSVYVRSHGQEGPANSAVIRKVISEQKSPTQSMDENIKVA